MGTSCILNSFQANSHYFSTGQLKPRCQVHAAQNFSCSPLTFISGLQRALLLYQDVKQGLWPPNLYGTFKIPLDCSRHLLFCMFLARWETIPSAITQEKDIASRLCFVRKVSDLHFSRYVTFCNIVLDRGKMVWIKPTLIYWKNKKIAMWIEHTSGEPLQQLMEKTWSEDLITC